MCESEEFIKDRKRLECEIQHLIKTFEQRHNVCVANLRVYHQATFDGGIEPCSQVVAYTGAPNGATLKT